MAKETPLVKQYQSIKSQYPDTFLFFRLGDFYELFDDDAIEASKIMEVTLTKRQDRPMCGVPYHAARTYIKKLLAQSKSVAICEQVEDVSQAKGIVKRDVIRVITPGTIVEDELLTGDTNNFISSVYCSGGHCGIVFMDISTGDFTGTQLDGMDKLESELSRFPVREAVISSDDEKLREFLGRRFPEITVTQRDSWYFSESKAEESIKSYFEISTLKGWELDKYPQAAAACGGLAKYLSDTHKESKVKFKSFHLYSREDHLILDRSSQENLELIRNLQDGSKKNTLFEILDSTDTSMGRRKLAQYIVRPLKDAEHIRARLNAVESLIQDYEMSGKISAVLKGFSDIERIISKTGFGTCNARDLVSLRESLKSIPEIKTVLGGSVSGILGEIRDGLDEMKELTDELDAALVDSPGLTVTDGGIIKKGYDKQLDELIETASGDKKWIAALEERERDRLKIPSLKVGFNKVHGYYIEVTKTHTSKVPEEYSRKQTLVNAERYITEELKNREDSILGAEERKSSMEYEIFCRLRDMAAMRTSDIQKNGELISTLDVLNSFGSVSRSNSYVKPHVGDWDEIKITDGRHPVVEKNLGMNEFVPNDTTLDSSANQILIITGPNMAGKSTYLKQVAVITLMAQIGCFVPAAEARIGAVDRIFTRIGAGENLAGGESTFMVEMTEVASILNNATRRSLLVMDEVGRGTSTFDGISIAWAVIEAVSGIKARTLFATHYFELTELPEYLENVRNCNFEVREWKDRKKIVFLRKLQEGSADKSYGIHCAQLAGVPEQVIKRAWEIFRSLEEGEFEVGAASGKEGQSQREPQLHLFGDYIYRDRIRELDLNVMAPVDVVGEIKKWQEEIE